MYPRIDVKACGMYIAAHAYRQEISMPWVVVFYCVAHGLCVSAVMAGAVPLRVSALPSSTTVEGEANLSGTKQNTSLHFIR